MEAKHHPFEKEKHVLNLHFWVFISNFEGVGGWITIQL